MGTVMSKPLPDPELQSLSLERCGGALLSQAVREAWLAGSLWLPSAKLFIGHSFHLSVTRRAPEPPLPPPQGSIQQLGTPLPPLKRLGQIFFRAFGRSKTFFGAFGAN